MPTLDEIVAGAATGGGGGDEEIDLDFSGALDFEALPPGEYAARITECLPGVAASSGKPKLVIKYTITEAPYVGRVIQSHLPTTGKASGKAKQVIKALGGDVTGDRIRFKPSSAVTRDVILVLAIQKDNSDFNEVRRVKPAAS